MGFYTSIEITILMETWFTKIRVVVSRVIWAIIFIDLIKLAVVFLCM